MVKNLPILQEMGVQSPGREDPLEKEMATNSSTLAWKILWTMATAHGVAKSQTPLNDFSLTVLQGRVSSDSMMDLFF